MVRSRQDGDPAPHRDKNRRCSAIRSQHLQLENLTCVVPPLCVQKHFSLAAARAAKACFPGVGRRPFGWAVIWLTGSDWVLGTANPYRSYSSAEHFVRKEPRRCRRGYALSMLTGCRCSAGCRPQWTKAAPTSLCSSPSIYVPEWREHGTTAAVQAQGTAATPLQEADKRASLH
jgi:hypothetical protein